MDFRYTWRIRERIQLEPWRSLLPASLVLSVGEWHAWAIEHTAGAPEDCLTAEERERARRFHFSRDRDAFVATRTTLRRLLAAYTGAKPEAIELTSSARQKPILAGGNLHFNVTHSGGISLLAFAHEDVGVDIEQIRPIADMDKIVQRNFAAGEQQQWHELPDDQREEAFFLAWTRKEAYVKALGEGLHFPLADFTVSLSPLETAAFRNVPGWSLHEFAIPGFASALAIRGSGHKQRAWML